MQEARDKISSLLENKSYSIIFKSSTDIGRTILFEMDIQTMGLPIAQKLYPIPFKHQKMLDEELCLLEDAGCISRSLSPWVVPVIIVPKTPDPL